MKDLYNENYKTLLKEIKDTKEKAYHVHIDQWNKTGSPELTPRIHSQLVFDKGAKNGERIVSSRSVVGKTG